MTLTSKINAMIEDALPRFALGEEIEYEASIVLAPAPNGQPAPMIALTFACKAVTIGEWHSGVVMMQCALPVQEQIDDVVQNAVGQLLAIRSQHASAALSSQNGHGHTDPAQAKGLIYPGQ